MDYYGGRTFFGEPKATLARVLPILADSERMRTIGRAAVDVLLAMPDVDRDHVAALGYGAGGRIVLELASSGVAFDATAVIHPALPEAVPEDWQARGPFLLCTGSEDPICTPDQLLTFSRALQASGADWRMNVYGGAQHAWAEPRNDDGSPSGGAAHAGATVPGIGHHPQHALRAWRAVLDLFAETIGTHTRL